MKSKEIILNVAMKEVLSLNLDSYHTIFLANMIARKIRHPEESTKELLTKVMHDMLRIYKEKKNLIEVSAKRSKEQLEEALDGSKTIPEEWLRGDIVNVAVKELSKIVIEKLDVDNN